MDALALGWASIAWAAPGGLPACQTQLNTCNANLGTCNTDLGTRTTERDTCNANLGMCTTDLATCQTDLAAAQQFPATGQTTSFRVGDDGDIEAGATLSYTDTGNGTIIDDNTGLEWEKKSDDGTIHDKDTPYTWENAFAVHVAGLNTEPCFAGTCDWRLPNVKELQSIVDYGRSNPSIDPRFGPTAASSYWSSTTFAGTPAFAWVVFFGGGNVLPGNKSFDFRVRAVRGGL